MNNYRAIVTVSFFALCTTSYARDTTASSEKRLFNITAPSIMQALREFTEQSGLQLLIPADQVRDEPAPHVTGRYTPAAALDHLLEGSGLHYEFANGRTIAIRTAQVGTSGVRASLPDGAAVTQRENERTELTGPSESRTQQVKSADEPEVVVVGSHIAGVATQTTSVVIYGREEIQQTGAATLQDFARKMPQNFASVDSSTAQTGLPTSGGFDQGGQNAFAGSGFNLHGMGVGATLTLVNGHRIAPAGADGQFVDVSHIPLAAVERVEVLPDGASALYGADAIAGVVNLKLRSDFQGGETVARYSGATRGGDRSVLGSQVMGFGWDSGSVLASYEHEKRSGLLTSDRDYLNVIRVPSQVIPETKRDNVFLSVQQSLSASTSVGVDGYFSVRESAVQTFGGLGPGGVNRLRRGELKSSLSGGAVDLRHELTDDWSLGVTGNFSRQLQSAERFVYGSTAAPVRTNFDSKLYSIDVLATGSLPEIIGTTPKVALGAGQRRESVYGSTIAGSALSRDVTSASGEIFMPLVEPEHSRTGVYSLAASLAARYDRYSGVGSSTNPRVGIAWAPVRSLRMRGAYSTSFRPPLITQSYISPFYVQLSIPNSDSPTGQTVTLIDASSGNANLNPETSKSISFGLDFLPERLPSLFITANYYRIKYEDRIDIPPIVGGNSQIFSAENAAVRPFLDLTPSAETVQQAYASGNVVDETGLGAAGVEAIFDQRTTNIASTVESVIELTAKYSWETAYGDIGMTVGGNYLLNMDYEPIAGGTKVELVNRTGQPPDLRVRAAVTWAYRAFSSAVNISYVDAYENNLMTPRGSIASWTTADLHLRYSFGRERSSLLRDWDIVLDCQNILDRNPPFVSQPPPVFTVGYDSRNAFPTGRSLAVQVRKEW